MNTRSTTAPIPEHTIETNVGAIFSELYRKQIERICADVQNLHNWADVRIMPVEFIPGKPTVWTIRAKCNGAALRDLVNELDRAGFLD